MPGWAEASGAWFQGIVGTWMGEDAFLGIRWMTLAAAALVLIAVACADGLLRWLIRRKFRHAEAARAPLLTLLWVYGVSASASLVLLDLEFLAAADKALRALKAVTQVGWLVGLVWLLWRLGGVVEGRLKARSDREGSTWDRVLFPLAGRAVRLMAPLVVLILGVPALPLPPEVREVLGNLVSLLLIGAMALLLFRLVQAVEDFVLARYSLQAADNLEARKIYTQVTVLKKVAVVIIGVFTLASMLMVFDSVRQFGTSILASAGIAGVIIGFAAQRSLATLIAGFQLAVTQPIRIDDVVIVENEWGRIEDITLTYVVVRIWDLRRLVLPITYFIERPFQNWTRSSAEILGTVFLHVDYTMPIQPLREELGRILAASPHWDGKVNGLVVTDSKERTMEVRALVSAADAGAAWDLRCEVREKLIDFIRKNYPDCLPRLRTALERVPDALLVRGSSETGGM